MRSSLRRQYLAAVGAVGVSALAGCSLVDSETESTPETTGPSISNFSLSNMSGRELQVSLESDSTLATIRVSVNGPDATVLTKEDFDETGDGPYTYEATLTVESGGEYTAVLEEAADEDGADGADGESVGISVGSPDSSGEIDGFEDGNFSEYAGDVDGFEVQSSVVANGEYALRGQVQNGDNKAIHRNVGFTQPNRVQGHVRVSAGGGNENAKISYLDGGSSGNLILHIDFYMNAGSDGYGDESGQPELQINGTTVSDDIEYDTWYAVALESIDWETETVGEVSLDGSVVARDVAFQESAPGVDTLRLKVNDWEDEIGWFDDVSVGE